MSNRCVITIIQNKRVSLPFIFGRYCLPRMKDLFDGEIELYHVFHDFHFQHDELESNRSYGELHLDRVRMFIDGEAFSEAKIIRHREVNYDHFAVPSFIKAAEVALEREADFHLWMEDDAIVLDEDCDRWGELLKGCDVGIYRDTRRHKMFNTAFFLSTREFDEKAVTALRGYERDSAVDYFKMGHGSQIEHTMWRASRKQAVLNKRYASRHHPGGKWGTVSELRKWVKDAIPEITDEHLSYLYLDFGDE
jgi:hypothetical protein